MENRFIYLRKKLFILRRFLGLLPYQKIFKRLQQNIIDLNTWNALDIFAGDGKQSSLDMKKYINNIELWDNNPNFESNLKERFPNSSIKIVDSYEEINKTNNKYNIILVDNWPRIISGNCEHFDLFPKIIELMKDTGILIILTMPEINNIALFSDQHIQLRKTFYNVEDVAKIPMDNLVSTYKNFANQHGFTLIDWFYIDRWFMYRFTKWFRTKRLCFLVLYLEK